MEAPRKAARLALMMFLQYAAMGAALSTLGLVLGSHGMTSLIGPTFALGGLVTIFFPVLVGVVADRFVAAQYLLIWLNVICAGALLGLPAAVETHSARSFLALTGLFYSCFVPATALANRIAFHALGADKKRFTLVRTCGTLGFFSGTVLIGVAGFSASVATFRVAAGASVAVAVLGPFLAHTPPGKANEPLRMRELFGLDALELLRNPQYRVFLLCTVLLFVPMMAHLSYLSLFLGAKDYSNVATMLSMGQISELIFMALLAFLLTRWGFKPVLLTAAGAWVIRMLLFAYASTQQTTALILLGIALHGVAWDFFFVTGEIYSNELASAAIKAQAQGLWKTITFGLGVLFGSVITGSIFSQLVTVEGAGGLRQWKNFWLVAAGCSTAALVILLLWFKPTGTAALRGVTAQPELFAEGGV